MPADFFSLIEYRMYLDNTEEFISLQNNVSRPLDYVRLTPILFNHWLKWAEEQAQAKMEAQAIQHNASPQTITPFGTKICPSWMKEKFTGLEEFYKYYIELLGV